MNCTTVTANLTLNFDGTFGVAINHTKSSKLKLETTLVNATFKVNDFYISPMSGFHSFVLERCMGG